MKVLIIDDDESVRYMLNEICDFAGWKAIVCSNGKEGVSQLLENEVDVVLVDFHMPEMDGLKTVDEIRKFNEEVPILVLTVDERQEIADCFLNKGATDFALKPIKAPDLISRIQLHRRLFEATMKKKDDVFVTKGISQTTLTHVSVFLQSSSYPCAIAEITKEVGLAYPTVYRCLVHLIQQEKIRSIVSYQKIGRPKNLYQWI
ncbi:two-component system response regulator [Bacillus sp. V2I10]|uniref:response regulator n=1 Tax=Bacillus sp. V2I10 TaxID=3042276 RepID=UPI00278850A6|nr:response regulator [Bacillus sp. V2I10]MDQ0859617.1 two-component system response regulator DctR [Bacillus sp. V2I10]